MSKTDDKIEELTHIIQHGVGITRTDASMDIFFDKLIGNIPLGSDAPSFASRKRMIVAQYYRKVVNEAGGAVLGFFLTAIFGFMIYAELTHDGRLDWWLPIATIAFLLLSIFSFKSMRENYTIVKALKKVEPTQPDPQPRSIGIYDKSKMAEQFGKQRLQSRVSGFLIMLVSGGILWNFFQHPPEQVVKIFIILPFFFMLGLSLVIKPMNRAENRYLYNSAQISWWHMPLVTKICTVIGAIGSVVLLGIIEGFIQI